MRCDNPDILNALDCETKTLLSGGSTIWNLLCEMHIFSSRLLAFSLIQLSLVASGSILPSIGGGQGNMAQAVEGDDVGLQGVKMKVKSIDAVFSDLDGTLIHYPTDIDAFLTSESATEVILLPPSSTGMVGVMSSNAIRLVRDIRRTGVKFVFLSGMRTSTLLKRLPFLPKADAYCCEAGGRIFYPIEVTDGAFTVQPKAFAGSIATDLDPFSLIEDLEWRSRIEQSEAAGKDGFVGNELVPNSVSCTVPISLREGRLWAFAQFLAGKGFIIDSKGYSTCFRLNRKQQSSSAEFDRLLAVVNTELPCGLSTSINLGCVDVYPSFCGKKNCCVYVAKVLGFSDNSVPERCVCLCDDDNDLEMAFECLHAYIPQVTSTSMADAIRLHPDKFTLTSSEDASNTAATEEALQYVLDKIRGGGSQR